MLEFCEVAESFCFLFVFFYYSDLKPYARFLAQFEQSAVLCGAGMAFQSYKVYILICFCVVNVLRQKKCLPLLCLDLQNCKHAFD